MNTVVLSAKVNSSIEFCNYSSYCILAYLYCSYIDDSLYGWNVICFFGDESTDLFHPRISSSMGWGQGCGHAYSVWRLINLSDIFSDRNCRHSFKQMRRSAILLIPLLMTSCCVWPLILAWSQTHSTSSSIVLSTGLRSVSFARMNV